MLAEGDWAKSEEAKRSARGAKNRARIIDEYTAERLGRAVRIVLRQPGLPCGEFNSHHALALKHRVEAVGDEMREGLSPSIRPLDLRPVQALMIAEPKVDAQIVIGRCKRHVREPQAYARRFR